MTPRRATLLVLASFTVACGGGSGTQGDPTDSGGGTTAPPVAALEVLEVEAVPVQLVADAGSIYWTDRTEQPVKRADASGAITVLAHRLANPASLAIEAGRLYWTDLRYGTSASGCSGAMSVAAMVHAALDGSDWRVAAIGDACYGASGTVVGGSTAYWTTSSSPLATLQTVPLAGGAPTTIATAYGIHGLTRDATHLYWEEGSFPDATVIKRMPLGGGLPETVIASTTENPITLFSVANGRVAFVELGYPYPYVYRIRSVGAAGGPTTLHAESVSGFVPFPPALPNLIALTATHVAWAGDNELYAVPLTGGTRQALLDGTEKVTALVAEPGGDLIVAATPGTSRTSPASLHAVPVDGSAPRLLADDLEQLRNLIVDGTTLYWSASGATPEIEGQSGVMRMSLTGGMPVRVIDGVADTPSIAAGGGRIVAGDHWRVKELDPGGGMPTLRNHPDDGVGTLSFDGPDAYGLVAAGIVHVPPLGSSPEIVPASLPLMMPLRALRASHGYLYWISEGGPNPGVQRISVHGGPVETVASSIPYCSDLQTDGVNVYLWCTAEAQLLKVPVTGGTPVAVAWGSRLRALDTMIAIDGAWLYRLDPFGIYRLPLAGGAEKEIAVLPYSGAWQPTNFAAMQGSLFFTDLTLNAIFSFTP